MKNSKTVTWRANDSKDQFRAADEIMVLDHQGYKPGSPVSVNNGVFHLVMELPHKPHAPERISQIKPVNRSRPSSPRNNGLSQIKQEAAAIEYDAHCRTGSLEINKGWFARQKDALVAKIAGLYR